MARLWLLSSLLFMAGAQSVPAERTGSISGIVVRTGAEEAIEDVQVDLEPVRLSPPEPRPLPTFRPFRTNEAGRFEFNNLPPGRYRVRWRRKGFFPPAPGSETNGIPIQTDETRISSDAFAFETYIHGEGMPGSVALSVPLEGKVAAVRASSTFLDVDVGRDQRVEDLRLPLEPGGVIAGRILDSRGRPHVRGVVEAMRVVYWAGRPFLVDRGGMAITNDRGEFRLFGLEPDSYYVRVANPEDLPLPAQHNGLYFPGVDLDASVPITIRAGSEFRNASFVLRSFPTMKVSGTISVKGASFPTANPANTGQSPNLLQIFLFRRDPGDSDGIRPYVPEEPHMVGNADSGTAAFAIHGVRPGDYDVFATLSSRQRSGLDRPEPLVGWTPIRVGAADVEGVLIDIGSLSEISGRVTFDSGSPGDVAFEKMEVQLTPRSALYPDIEAMRPSKNVKPDRSFALRTLPGLLYGVEMNGLPEGVAVVDVREDGASIYDEGVFVGKNNLPIEIVLSRNVGTIQVQVTGDGGKDVSGSVVALIPEPDRRKNPVLYRRTTFDGEKRQYPPLVGVPPGEYKLFAWDNIPVGAERNEGFLREYEDRGVRVTVPPNGTVSVQVPVIMVREKEQ